MSYPDDTVPRDELGVRRSTRLQSRSHAGSGRFSGGYVSDPESSVYRHDVLSRSNRSTGSVQSESGSESDSPSVRTARNQSSSDRRTPVAERTADSTPRSSSHRRTTAPSSGHPRYSRYPSIEPDAGRSNRDRSSRDQHSGRPEQSTTGSDSDPEDPDPSRGKLTQRQVEQVQEYLEWQARKQARRESRRQPTATEPARTHVAGTVQNALSQRQTSHGRSGTSSHRQSDQRKAQPTTVQQESDEDESFQGYLASGAVAEFAEWRRVNKEHFGLLDRLASRLQDSSHRIDSDRSKLYAETDTVGRKVDSIGERLAKTDRFDSRPERNLHVHRPGDRYGYRTHAPDDEPVVHRTEVTPMVRTDDYPVRTVRQGSVPLSVVAEDPLVKWYYPKAAEYPNYDGRKETNHREFIHKMNNMISRSKVPEGEVISKLPVCLSGPAKSWYYDRISEPNEPQTWEEWATAICKFHETTTWREWLRKEIRNYRFPEKERDPAEWLSKLHAMIKWENPMASLEAIQIDLHNNMPKYVRELLEVAAPLGCTMSTFRENFVNLATIRGGGDRNNDTSARNAPSLHQDRPKSSFRQNQAQPVRFATGANPTPLGTSRYPPRVMVNVNTPRPRMAEPNRNVSTAPNRNAGQTGASANVMCYNCREYGHFASDCPKPRRVQALGNSENLDRPDEDSTEPNDDTYQSHANLDDHEAFMQPEYFDWADEMLKDDAPADFDNSEQNVQSLDVMFDNDIDDSLHHVEVEKHKVVQFESKPASLLTPQEGLHLVKKTKLYSQPSVLETHVDVLDMHVLGKTPRVLAIMQNKPVMLLLDSVAAVSVINRTFLEEIVPDWQKRIVPAKVKALQAFGHGINPLGLFQTDLIFPHPRSCVKLDVAFLVIETTGPCPVLLGSDMMTMYRIDLIASKGRYMRIGTFQSKFAVQMSRITDNSLQANRFTEVTDFEFQTALKDAEFDPGLTPEQMSSLEKILMQNKDAFAYGARQLGEARIKAMVLEVDIPDPIPTRLKMHPYPASPKTKQDISDSIDELLDLGVIRKSNSEFSSPVVMVYKNGKGRLCINYKALNDYTRAFLYPLPRITETLGMIKEAQFISSLDMNKGFHQCWVDESSRKYTAFASHRGLYEYVRMPFGLKNAPAHFQQAMDTILGHLLREGWVKVYIDDVIVFSKTFQEHQIHLEKVLEAIANAGFTISIKKCQFGFKELRALGRKVSGLDLAADPHKIAAVADWPRPTNKRQLQSFLGFINYHRAHIPDLARILKPLNPLTSSTAVWEWTKEREDAFQEAKRALLAPAVLAMPDFSLPFKLYIDACFEGLGAALTQVQQNKERPVAFILRRLRPSEERYAATQLECLGLIWALEKLYYYLDGAHFEVYTDCQAIKTLMTVKNSNRHMLRWQLAVQEHRGHMTVIHRPGKDNKNADGLSRSALPNDQTNPASDLTDDLPLVYAVSIVEMNDEWFNKIKRGYLEDKTLTNIIIALRDGSAAAKGQAEEELNDKERGDLRKGLFFVMDSLLYKRIGPLSSVLVLPDKDTKQQLLKACHDAITAGHWGYDRTLDRVKKYAYWFNMNSDIKAYIDSCQVCLASKRSTGPVPGLMMKTGTPKRPWEVIHIDFVTALPKAGPDYNNAVLVVVDRFTKKAKFLPTHDDANGKQTAMIYWKFLFSEYGMPRIIISDRDSKFTAGFWSRLFKMMGVKLHFSTAYHPQTDGQAERTIQTMVDMIRRYCAFGLIFNDPEGYRHDWVSLLPALEIAYNSSKHSVTNRTPFELEKGWNPLLPAALMQGDGLDQLPADPNAKPFAEMMIQAKDYAMDCIDSAFEAAKRRYDSHHTDTKVKPGDLVMLSTKFFGLVGSRKLKDHWVGPFEIERMIGDNAARLKLQAPYNRKHPVFPVSLLKFASRPLPGTVADRKQPERRAPLRMADDGLPEYDVVEVSDERILVRNGQEMHEFEVYWKDYSEPTWEPAELIQQDVPQLVRDFRIRKRRQRENAVH